MISSSLSLKKQIERDIFRTDFHSQSFLNVPVEFLAFFQGLASGSAAPSLPGHQDQYNLTVMALHSMNKPFIKQVLLSDIEIIYSLCIIDLCLHLKMSFEIHIITNTVL